MFSAFRFLVLKMKSFESKTMTIFLLLFHTPTLHRDSFELKASQDWVPNIKKTFCILKIYRERLGGSVH